MNSPAREGTAGRIITFYSYKGGAGRTMALANVAWILASNGYRVLTIDWDLESPGLHRYFSPFLKDRELRVSDGVIDLIRRCAEATVDESAPADWAAYVDVREGYTASLSFRFGPGGLEFMGPGRQDEAYSAAVSTFDWDAFWKNSNGGVFLEQLRQYLRRTYDFVLIDSRTGLSDTAGICTVEMPDAVVNCFTLNTQSIDGAAAVGEDIARQRRDPLMIYPVPSRVEDGEQEKLSRG